MGAAARVRPQQHPREADLALPGRQQQRQPDNHHELAGLRRLHPERAEGEPALRAVDLHPHLQHQPQCAHHGREGQRIELPHELGRNECRGRSHNHAHHDEEHLTLEKVAVGAR